MTETLPDTRNRSEGSAADRKLTTQTVAAGGAGASLAIGFTQWFFQCTATGTWHWVAPSQDMIWMGAPLIILPVGLWVSNVLSLIGTIIVNRLRRDADT